MARHEEVIIHENTPFADIGPLSRYLESLKEVTTEPNEDHIFDVMVNDAVLTERAVLFPVDVNDPGEGYTPCTVSDGVETVSTLALYEFGSQEYLDAHAGIYTHWNPQVPVPDRTTPEHRRSVANAAVLMLGSKAVISGAFDVADIPDAFGEIIDTIDMLGGHDASFTDFGLDYFDRRLREELAAARQGHFNEGLMNRRETIKSLKSALTTVKRCR
ncbi:MAG TPA: hypothetical protein VF572_01460 [Candidatus Saccharimonadales bacterium]|jgi:hypothetical protein